MSDPNQEEQLYSQAEAKHLEKDEAARKKQLEWQNDWRKYLWLAVGLGTLLFYAKEKHHRETFNDNYIETAGKVLSQRETFEARNDGWRGMPNGWEIKYEFSVNGQLHKGVDQLENTKQPPITVFYRLDDPTINTLEWGGSGLFGWPAEDPVEALLFLVIFSLLMARSWRFSKWIKT
jgi:hypothetical protein